MEQSFSKLDRLHVTGRAPTSAEMESRLTKLILTPLTNQEWNQLIKNAQQLYEKCAPGQAMSKCFRYFLQHFIYNNNFEKCFDPQVLDLDAVGKINALMLD